MKRRPRWRRRKEARPREILAAALATFVERGYKATTLADVARRAGVSKGTLYLYYKNKERLFRAVAGEAGLPTVESGEALLRTHRGSSEDLVRKILLDWWEGVWETPAAGLTKLMVAESGNLPRAATYLFREVVQRRRRLLERALRRGIRRGEFRAVPLPEAVRLAAAPILLSLIWAHSVAGKDRYVPDPDAMVRLHVQLFTEALRR
jgi:AcrR family transcriptional regulator